MLGYGQAKKMKMVKCPKFSGERQASPVAQCEMWHGGGLGAIRRPHCWEKGHEGGQGTCPRVGETRAESGQPAGRL